MGGEVHWDLSGKCGFKRNEKWYDHVPKVCLKMKIQTLVGLQCVNRSWK